MCYDIGMKECIKCKSEKPLEEFNRSPKNKGGRHSYCRVCQKEHYKNNSVSHKANVKKNKIRSMSIAREFIWERLAEGCVDCGESDPIVLEFDHVDREDKALNVSAMIRSGYGLDRIKKEVEKCLVRCCNCHRRRTTHQFDWWKLTYASVSPPASNRSLKA